MRKYYLAYEERYRKLHDEGLTWFSDIPSPELLDWVENNNISLEDEICEIGCGEGRDALYLSNKGYKVTAIDVSESAILKCKELARIKGVHIDLKVADALSLSEVTRKYKWVYSIATLHMLVDDNDRYNYLTSLYNLLEPSGNLLLVNLGDGEHERKTDITHAFQLQERNHSASGRKVMIASTTYRGVNWDYHKKELERIGFNIEEAFNTENKEYGKCMTVYLSKKGDDDSKRYLKQGS